MQLPEIFLEQMKQLLGSDYDAYRKSYASKAICRTPHQRDKTDWETWESAPLFLYAGFLTEMVIILARMQKAPRHPYYYAGLYYLQGAWALALAAVPAGLPGR